jgi:hypothetical protein
MAPYWFIFFLESFEIGFIFFCIICLLGRLIAPQKLRPEFINIQSTVNFCLAIGATLNLLVLAYEIYEASVPGSEYESFAFVETTVWAGPYGIFYWTYIVGWVLGLLFFIRRIRQSWILSVLVLVLLNTYFFFNLFYGFLKDYLPSSWRTEYVSNYWLTCLQIIIFGVFTGLFYKILAKRKRLPHPSLWIS